MPVELDKEKMTKISSLFEHVSDIPPLPSVTQKILEVAENPLSSAYELADIISKDPSLTSQILKSANSAFYGFPNRIGTIYLATVILGFSTVRTIALGVCVMKLFGKKDDKDCPIDQKAFWSHSLKCAVASKLLATKYKYYVAGEAFTTGILHDIGKMVLSHFAPAQYAGVLAHREERQCTLLEAEQARLGFSHADVGGYLLEKWSLPIAIIDAVVHHHRPMEARHASDLASIIQLADYLAHLQSHRIGEELQAPLDNQRDWGSLAIPADEEKAIEGLMEEFNLELGKADSFLRILRGEDVPDHELKKHTPPKR
jgi:putative nucleotidyltransferase with HDIG domain